MTDRMLDLRDLAVVMGWTYSTARSNHGHAEQRRKQGHPLPGDLPPPDRRVGGSPAWWESTIRAWEPTRPGKGVGGGRPPKPYHVWPSNTDTRRPVSTDLCAACGVRRFSDDPKHIAVASGACPGDRGWREEVAQ